MDSEGDPFRVGQSSLFKHDRRDVRRVVIMILR